MRMHNPPHPAATIKEDVLPELVDPEQFSKAALARALLPY